MARTVLISKLPAPMSNVSGFLTMCPPLEWSQKLQRMGQERRANKRAARLAYLRRVAEGERHD